MELKKIKSVNAVRLNHVVRSINDKEIDIVEVPSSFKEFDIDGNLLCEINYNSSGDIAEKVEYDFKDKLLVEKRIFLDEFEVAETRKYIYNDAKNIDHAVILYTDNTVEKIIYKYDSNNNLISKFSEEGDGGHEEMEYKYGLLVYHKITDDFDEVEKEEIRKYNIHNKLEKIAIARYEDGEKINTVVLFDEDEKIIEEKAFSKADKLISTKSFIYDVKNNLIEICTSDVDGKSWLKMEYDDKGNEIVQFEMDEEENVHFRVQRAYDEFNNVRSADVEINNFGRTIDSNYRIEYSYSYY